MLVFYLDEEEIGKVFAYFPQINVAGIKLQNSVKTGEKIRVVGKTTNFIQLIDSIEIFSEQVNKAIVGQKVGIKVKYKCRPGDKVFKIHEF